MGDYVAGMRQMVMDGEMSFKMFVYNCGIHYGYNKCCVNNYVNLCVLGYPPAMFMVIMLDHHHGDNHVLCPACNDRWIADHPDYVFDKEFDTSRPDTVKDIAKFTSMKAKLQ